MNLLFLEYIKPLLESSKPRELLEIGVFKGYNTFYLLQWCSANNAHLASIDPTPWTGNIPTKLRLGAPNYRYKRGKPKEASAITPICIETICSSNLYTYWSCYKQLSLDFLASENFQGGDAFFIDGDHNYYTVFNELRLIHMRTQKREKIILIHDVANLSCARVDYYYDELTIPIEYRHGAKQGIVTAIEDFVTIYPYTFEIITTEKRGLGILQYAG